MNNFPNPNTVRFLHESVVNRFVKLLAMERAARQEKHADHDVRMAEMEVIRRSYIVVNPDRT